MSSDGAVSVFTCENSFIDPWRDLKLGWADTGMINEQPLAPLALRTPIPSCGHRTTQYGAVLVSGTPIEANNNRTFVASTIGGETVIENVCTGS